MSINDTGITAIGYDVIVRRIEGRTKSDTGLLYLPDNTGHWDPIGQVLSVGPRVESEEIVEGAWVLFKTRPSSALVPDTREGGREEWKRVVRLREEDILGIVDERDVPGVEVMA